MADTPAKRYANNAARVMSDKQRVAAIERLRIAREASKIQGNEAEISHERVADVGR